MPNTTLTIRVDSEIKQQAQSILSDIGLDMTSAINVYLRKIIQHEGIPFELKRTPYNEETMQIIEEANRGKNLCGPFESVSELMEALDADD